MSGFGLGAAFSPAVNFIAKPFSADALVNLVRRILAARHNDLACSTFRRALQCAAVFDVSGNRGEGIQTAAE